MPGGHGKPVAPTELGASVWRWLNVKAEEARLCLYSADKGHGETPIAVDETLDLPAGAHTIPGWARRQAAAAMTDL